MSDPHPFTGFGDDTNSAVKFSVLVPDRGGLPAWTGGDPIGVQRAVALSSSVITQTWGYTPREIVLRCMFDTREDFELAEALQGQRATLRIPYGVTQNAGASATNLLGALYLVLPETLLSPPGSPIANREPGVDGIWEADLTFQRTSEVPA